MKTQVKRWFSGALALALSLPVAGVALSQDSAEDNRPRAERQNDDGAREDRADPEENRAQDNRNDGAAQDREERQPRSIRNDQAAPRDNVRTNVQGGSPSDLQTPPAPIERGDNQVQPVPMSQHHGVVSQGNCCCGNNGGAVYSQNNGYRSARTMNNGGYRSFSYQGGEDTAMIQQAAPAPVYYNNSYNNGYYSSGRFGGVQNGANWDRFNEHDSRNFSGSYGSRASLRSR